MFRIISRYKGKFGEYENLLYYKGKYWATLTKKNFKSVEGYTYIEYKSAEMENGIAVFYDSSVKIEKEKPVLCVTSADEEGLKQALDFLNKK